MERCGWCLSDPAYIDYHDKEWGVPLHDETRLFEMLILEGAQAGLSWLTILKRRESYRSAFDYFDAEAIAEYGPKKVTELLANPGIIRNRLKIESAIRNARTVLLIRGKYGSLDNFLWNFIDGQPLQNRRQSLDDIPVNTPMAKTISEELKMLGCNFIGPTICYAYMQSIGMVNDHLLDCFRHSELLNMPA